jgi:NAD+ synthase (glutamine-hydrolysing)
MCANGIADAVSEEIPTLLPSQAWEEEAEIYAAIVMGVRDYVRLNGFDGAVLGLSGGIDSALVLAIAADALGPDAVEAVMMPTVYTAQMSLDDACKQAQTLGVKYHVIPIQAITAAFDKVLQPLFEGLAMDTTEENIQARSRGMILMAISNKMRKIVLTTGNKSEMAVGYATLYGDMAGGFAPIKDLPKMWVYRLARYRNSVSAVIPQRVIDRPPSAELRPDQKDEDTLPPYPVLDEILERYIHQDQSIEEMVRAGLDEGQVREVVRLVDLNEYKRRQAAPGVKVGVRAFGRDRRYPITSGFRHRALAEPDQSIQAAPLFQSLLKSGSENTGPESNGTENTGSDSTGSESKGAERDG